jgi:uncharacterized membrane protein
MKALLELYFMAAALLLLNALSTQAFPSVYIIQQQRSFVLNAYGRGAEIWPPSNENPIQLSDSFPNNVIPESAKALLRMVPSDETLTVVPNTTSWRNKAKRAMRRILRRAAASEQEQQQTAQMDYNYNNNNGRPNNSGAMNQLPALIATCLLYFVQPLDILLSLFFSGYLYLLATAASGARRDTTTRLVPALPPQGHVPYLVANPLGQELTDSILYDQWLQVGVLLGLIAPVALVVSQACCLSNMAAAKACARPLFVLCVQALTEHKSRQEPLPLRILVPVLYNSVRVAYVWNWMTSTVTLGRVGRALAILNVVYWLTNLFGFLLPVAVMRYLRAYFVCVEAEQVTLRSGMEDSIGLLP